MTSRAKKQSEHGTEPAGNDPCDHTGCCGSASRYRPGLRADTQEVFRHGCTYSGHTMVCAVGVASLDVIEREQLIQRVRELEPVLAKVLIPPADHRLAGEVRVGAGLLAAVEIADEARVADPGSECAW